MNGRETALKALIACRKQGAWSNGILKTYISQGKLDRREAALAVRLCSGVLQNREKLDFYLKQLLTGRIKDLHPAVRDILHLGLYQIFENDRIPDAAAVNESVALAKKYCRFQKNAPGLVNAVLRGAIRAGSTLRQPVELKDRYSHPQPLIDALTDSVGPERIEAVLAANNTTPPTVIQTNTLRTSTDALIVSLEKEGVSARRHPWMPDCLTLSHTGDLECLEAYRNGGFYVQDAAARLSVLCAGLPVGERTRVLDCCAAPGGKSFAAAIAMGGRGTVHACDIHPHKIELLRRGAERLGLGCVQTRMADATDVCPEWRGMMDAVIADVPCSGLGIIRKKPDIRYKSMEEIGALPQLQRSILRAQAEHVKPGGVLLYSTCTLLRAENEAVIEAFLGERPDFVPEPLPLPDVFPKNQTGMLTLLPGQYDTDGFFICRLRRRS